MSFIDLSKNNTDLKSYKYELVMFKDKLPSLRGEERETVVKRMKYIRRKIRECDSKKGYGFKKVGSIGYGSVLESKRCGTVITDRVYSRGRYAGKPHSMPITRALTYEEHQELLRQKRERDKVKC